jgi:hypothetical protein
MHRVPHSRACALQILSCGGESYEKELLLQSLEHERGGVKVYETALRCVINDDLKEEWTRYLSQTRNHVTILTEACQKLSIEPQQMTPGRQVVGFVGHSHQRPCGLAADPEVRQP